MSKILTVIVPVYNIEKYVFQCLDSLNIKEEKDSLEVLVIDDGSTDTSGELADKFAGEHCEIFRVIHKANGGHGSAINRGIEEAKGRYIKVVDGDDWVSKSEFLNLIRFLKHTKADIVAANYCWYYEQSGKKKIQYRHPFKGVFYGKEYALSRLPENVYVKMHAMTAKTELFRRCPFKIDENCFYVDTEFVLYPILYAETVVFLDSFVYMYRIGLPTQSMNINQLKKNKNQHLSVIYSLIRFYDYMKANNKEFYRLGYVENAIAKMVASQFKVFMCCDFSAELEKEVAAFDEFIKNNYPEIYDKNCNPCVSLIRQSNYRFFHMALKLYQHAYKTERGEG